MEQTYSLQQTIEIAHIAVIMTDNEIVNDLYDSKLGYVNTTELVAKWALEFYNMYRNVNWEDILENNDGKVFPTNVISWDDAIIWFAHKKLKEHDKN